ncbi:MAG: branched chain amino acid aminotransferase, partial [Bacteroidia bacterium]|nr:branched chain amino acid aminotransferase [Bacteroidia bacterium]
MENIDWSNLGFGYMKTDYNVRCSYKDGEWGEIRTCTEETITMH